MSLFENCITEGSEKADELAKNGVMMHGGEMAQVRVITVQQKREEFYGALQYAVSFSLSGGGMARLCITQTQATREEDYRGQSVDETLIEWSRVWLQVSTVA